jgi:DNA-binding Lrp family transcriptional regulator
LDRIDRQILKSLNKNPQKPFLRIAKEIGVSIYTVQKRYEKMKKESVIFGSSIVIDLSKIGYQGKAFLLITISTGYGENNMVEALQQIPNVFLVSEIVGAFDLLAMVAFRNIAEMKKVVNKIRELPNVQKVEVALTDGTSYPVNEEYGNTPLF